jgi:hypothetical protein
VNGWAIHAQSHKPPGALFADGADRVYETNDSAERCLATWTIVRGARWEETGHRDLRGWPMFEVAESVTSGPSGQVMSPVVIDELPSIDDFHTFRLPAKEILASSSTRLCRHADNSVHQSLETRTGSDRSDPARWSRRLR